MLVSSSAAARFLHSLSMRITSWTNPLDSYLVTVMTEPDHFSAQAVRRWSAHASLLLSALLWPVLLLVWLTLLWIGAKAVALCTKEKSVA
jgi:hypothetical protein